MGNSWRLIKVTGKVLEQVLLEHISKHMEKVTRNSQHRFTKSKSCLTSLKIFCGKMAVFVDVKT